MATRINQLEHKGVDRWFGIVGYPGCFSRLGVGWGQKHIYFLFMVLMLCVIYQNASYFSIHVLLWWFWPSPDLIKV